MEEIILILPLLLVGLFMGFYLLHESVNKFSKTIGVFCIVCALIPLTIYTLIGATKTHENKSEVVEVQNENT